MITVGNTWNVFSPNCDVKVRQHWAVRSWSLKLGQTKMSMRSLIYPETLHCKWTTPLFTFLYSDSCSIVNLALQMERFPNPFCLFQVGNWMNLLSIKFKPNQSDCFLLPVEPCIYSLGLPLGALQLAALLPKLPGGIVRTSFPPRKAFRTVLCSTFSVKMPSCSYKTTATVASKLTSSAASRLAVAPLYS